MTYETFLAIMERTKKVKLSEAEQVIEELYRQTSFADDTIDEYCKLYDLFDLILQQPMLIGDSDDYHNLAVSCARKNDYDAACRFLDEGLKEYPYCIDLLADYLNYGMQCGKKEICCEIYDRLKSKKFDWNWRAYKFSIDYLMELSDIDCINRDDEIYSLIKEFQEKLPDDEDAYLVEAEFLRRKGANEKKDLDDTPTFVSVLTYVISDESPVKRTPKCDLRLADYYYENGWNIEKAIELLERCKKDSVEVQLSVNRSYVYLLSALCRMTQYYNNSSCDNLATIEKLAMDVYKNYHIASLNRTDTRVYNCRYLIESFVRETGVPYPYDDGVNNDI